MTLPYSCALYNLQCTYNVTNLSGVLFYTKTVLFHTVKNEASNFQKQTELKTKTHLFVFKFESAWATDQLVKIFSILLKILQSYSKFRFKN